ncbi:unnamed protein product [Miscanthus lutarioriparius]|uniref:Uncharacterized protein n=1 Tax=Miscanthus lutarioriparius TaxID=422564 RepID=A0A811QLI7_9POAL|nr:unnamed protein product [Miscanthus lutarioriparius]
MLSPPPAPPAAAQDEKRPSPPMKIPRWPVARFWVPIFRVWVYLGIAAIVLMTCVNIVYYMPVYGVYAMKYHLPPQQPAAAVVATPEQLPPPPPEMDMC